MPSQPPVVTPYVAGIVTTPAGQVASLLDLIQKQLAPNCSGTAVEFQVAADAANTGNVFCGAASALGGPLTTTNWGYALTPGGPARGYRATYPGTNTPLGEVQVLSAAASVLHVEVIG